MQEFKFAPNLRQMILSGEKYATWRIDEGDNIKIGDIVSFAGGGKEFAKAKVTSIKDVTFANMSDEDKKGHEKYASDAEKYATFSAYYVNKNIGPETLVKIIKYDVI